MIYRRQEWRGLLTCGRYKKLADPAPLVLFKYVEHAKLRVNARPLDGVCPRPAHADATRDSGCAIVARFLGH